MIVWTLKSFITMVFIVSTSFAQDSVVELAGGSLNGIYVEDGVLELSVAPEESIIGSITIQTYNTGCPTCVAPLVMVWNWGNHETSYGTIDGWIPLGIELYDVSVDLQSPSLEGIYFITFAFQWEMNGSQVASLTNWQVPGNPHWNDGHDIADWEISEYDQAVVEHMVNTLYEYEDGWEMTWVPAGMIRLVVGCIYVPGDCNHNGSPLELNDVVTMIGLYRGTADPEYTCACPPHGDEFVPEADPNGNCVSFELGDVVTEIGAYRGTDEASGCPDCPGVGG